jgi:hypothetical protein
VLKGELAAVKLTVGIVFTAALPLVLGAVLVPAPAPAQALSGLDLFRSRCDGCHELPEPDSPKRGRQAWDELLTRMIRVRGAVVSPSEKQSLLNFLDSFNREPREIRWLEEPATSRKAVFLPTDVGKLPAEWVDLTIGSDDAIPWAVQAEANGKQPFLTPLKPAPDTQFPVLIHNLGIVKNGTASARIQLLAGKSAGAGIIFGYRSPQAFFGARISARDVVLYEMQNGQRALRARAGLALPPKQWHTLAVSISGQGIEVSVNGKTIPELRRTLDSYRGGKVGLHTQGDTVARIDQWELAVR